MRNWPGKSFNILSKKTWLNFFALRHIDFSFVTQLTGKRTNCFNRHRQTNSLETRTKLKCQILYCTILNITVTCLHKMRLTIIDRRLFILANAICSSNYSSINKFQFVYTEKCISCKQHYIRIAELLIFFDCFDGIWISTQNICEKYNKNPKIFTKNSKMQKYLFFLRKGQNI